MNTFMTSYGKKENKEGTKIIFEEFPGEKTLKSLKEQKDKRKKTTKCILIIFILLLLFIGSSILNEKILYGNEGKDYKLINEFNGKYATVKADDRKKLFEDIGFDSVETKVETKDYNNYDITYAYRNSNGDKVQTVDWIRVYYDETLQVNYITLSLVYPKNEFSISSLVNDCNSVIKNFVNVKTSKNAIYEAKTNGIYYLKDRYTNAVVSYELSEKNNYYILTVMLER